MSETELPEDLAKLEFLLSERPRHAPRKKLRDNLLASVKDHAAVKRRRTSVWSFAASVAAFAPLC